MWFEVNPASSFRWRIHPICRLKKTNICYIPVIETPPLPSSYLAQPHIPVMRECLHPTSFCTNMYFPYVFLNRISQLYFSTVFLNCISQLYFSTVFLDSYSRNAGSPTPTSAFCANVSAAPASLSSPRSFYTHVTLLYIAVYMLPYEDVWVLSLCKHIVFWGVLLC